MRVIYTLLLSLTVLVIFSSCNDEWKDEQYAHYVSFKAPINSNGVTRINLPYKPSGHTTYELPIIISGSTTNDRSMTVKIGVDADTLKTLNIARFASREDLYYRQLGTQHYSFPETVEIKSGENIGYLSIDFNLDNLDLVEKWVLPLTIEDDPTNGYIPNYRKNYRKALLRIVPFNKYSGSYGGASLMNYIVDENSEGDKTPLVKSEIPSYAVDENTIFFYAGTIDENREDRGNYKIKAYFDPESNKVDLTCDNSAVKFRLKKQATYYIDEEMDAVRPYLKKRTIMIRDIDYEYTDYTAAPGAQITYQVTGEMAVQRNINTQIPDEDQAIEWD